jgi:predicted nucleic acid-binding Zn ribbon protein
MPADDQSPSTGDRGYPQGRPPAPRDSGGPQPPSEPSGAVDGARSPAADGSGPQRGAQPPSAAGDPDLAGPELARAVLDAALTKRREATRNPRRRSDGTESGRRLRGYSGPGPDPRDPQKFGAVLERLMRARGWEKPKAEATVFGAWERVVGPDVAQHSRPVKLDAGVLTVEAESTAWATQLRLLAATLLRKIAVEVGHNVVIRLQIHGPAAPSWSKGPRRVQGRGPRDTYG